MSAGQEEWRPVVGHEGRYEVSSLGRIRSLDRVVMVRRGARMVPARYRGRMLNPHIDNTGYPTVSLTQVKPTHVHVHVCEAFHGPRPPGYQVAHGDGVRANGRADNLRWATPSENNADKRLHGTVQDQRGEKGPGAKLSDAQVIWIHQSRGKIQQREMARHLGIDPSTVSNICTGKRWAHLASTGVSL